MKAPRPRARRPARADPYADVETRRFRCQRCWAAGRIHRRPGGTWPPWYVLWTREPLPPASEPVVVAEAQSAPMANALCPACRQPAGDGGRQFRANLVLWAAAGPPRTARA